jgi:hypothetical protein
MIFRSFAVKRITAASCLSVERKKLEQGNRITTVLKAVVIQFSRGIMRTCGPCFRDGKRNISRMYAYRWFLFAVIIVASWDFGGISRADEPSKCRQDPQACGGNPGG